MIKTRSTINAAAATLLILVLVVISGCTAGRTNLVKSGTLNLEQQATGKVYIAWSDAYEEEDGFVITGVLRRRDRVGGPIKTHVDITILSPEGAVLEEGRSSEVYVPRRIKSVKGRGYRSFKRFEVRFQNIPPQGSLVRVVSHSGQHDGATNS